MSTIRSQAPTRVHQNRPSHAAAQTPHARPATQTSHRGHDGVSLSAEARESISKDAGIAMGQVGGLAHGLGEGFHGAHSALEQVGGRVTDAVRRPLSHGAAGPLGEMAAKHSKTLGRIGLLAGAGIASVKTADALSNGQLNNAHKGEKIGGAWGEFGGAWAGGAAGAQLGASVGVVGGPVGIAIGGVAGGLVGAFAGGFAGEKAGGYAGEHLGHMFDRTH